MPAAPTRHPFNSLKNVKRKTYYVERKLSQLLAEPVGSLQFADHPA